MLKLTTSGVQRLAYSVTALLLIISGTAFAYERIISLAPSLTRDVYLLGIQDKLVGVTMYCPDFAKGKENVGSVQAPNLERIAALKPDVVLATKDGNDRRTVDKLRSMGINVYVLGSPSTIDTICSEFIELGKYLGVEATAKTIVKQAREKIQTVRTHIPANGQKKVFWQVGAHPIFTVSKNSFVNEFMALSGVKNVFQDLKARYPQITREAVIAADPDIIIIVTMDGEMSTEKANWAQFAQLSAVKNNRVFFIRDMMFDNPTPLALAEGIEKLQTIFYPTTK